MSSEEFDTFGKLRELVLAEALHEDGNQAGNHFVEVAFDTGAGDHDAVDDDGARIDGISGETIVRRKLVGIQAGAHRQFGLRERDCFVVVFPVSFVANAGYRQTTVLERLAPVARVDCFNGGDDDCQVLSLGE